MSVFVTGAGGFLGHSVVGEARRRGRDVQAMIRPASSSTNFAEGTTIVRGDLRQPGEWQTALASATEVIHCAAATSGDLASQLAGSVLATENLLAALSPDLRRFVHVSSFSVYDYDEPELFGTLDEETELEDEPLRRDPYTQTKLLQERLVRDHCAKAGIDLVVVRPGAIYGSKLDWDFGSAMSVGPFDLIFAPLSKMRLIHVDDCARALVAALDAPVDGELTVNVVAEKQPTHWTFHRRAKRAGADVGVAVPVPYPVVRALGGAAAVASKLFFKGKARLPEILDSPRQRARWRGLRTPVKRAEDTLGWRPEVRLNDAIMDIVKRRERP